jgi:hypothetical protein
MCVEIKAPKSGPRRHTAYVDVVRSPGNAEIGVKCALPNA